MKPAPLLLHHFYWVPSQHCWSTYHKAHSQKLPPKTCRLWRTGYFKKVPTSQWLLTSVVNISDTSHESSSTDIGTGRLAIKSGILFANSTMSLMLDSSSSVSDGKHNFQFRHWFACLDVVCKNVIFPRSTAVNRSGRLCLPILLPFYLLLAWFHPPLRRKGNPV